MVMSGPRTQIAARYLAYVSHHPTSKEVYMSKSLLRICAAFALLTAIGCGDDKPENTNNTNNTSPDMTPDMTATPDMTTTPDLPVVDDMGPDADMAVEEPGAPKCTDTPRPARCDEDPATFDQWQPASIISSFVLADGTCCFDYDGNDTPDNGLGSLLTDLGPTLGLDVNGTIASSIADGTIAIVLEHDGLTSTAVGTKFAMNFLLADPSDAANPAPVEAGANKYLINPASFDAGVWPQARTENAEILAGNKIVAGPGRLVLRLELLGITLDLIISKARIEGELDLANTDLATKGVAIKAGGKLGGVIRMADLFDAVNTFASTKCGCLGYTAGMTRAPLVAFSPADPGDAMCDENYTAGTCDEADDVEKICLTLVEDACGYFSTISIAADVRADGRSCVEGSNPPPCDAVSIGAKIGAYGAIIEGVAPAN
jgi:hypothetical protein